MYVLGQNLGMGKFNGVLSFPLIFQKKPTFSQKQQQRSLQKLQVPNFGFKWLILLPRDWIQEASRSTFFWNLALLAF